MKTTNQKIAMFVTLCACVCVQCFGIRTTKDYDNGYRVYKGGGTTKITFDFGETWIALEEKETSYCSSMSKQETKSDSADRLLNKLRKGGIASYVVKFGMGRRLGTDGKSMALMNLIQKQTLDMKTSKDRNYNNHVRYLYFEKVDLDKLVPALKKYHKSDSYRHSGNWYDYSTKPYGVFEIRTPITVMKCWKKDYDELVVDVEHPITLKRGWLIDIDTLDGMMQEID